MSIRKFYLRPNYRVELENTELTYPLSPSIRNLGAIAYQYRLGASASVAAALDMDSPLRESLDVRGISVYANKVPNDSETAVWRFSSRPLYGDALRNFCPLGDSVLLDHQQREAHCIGSVVLEALQENRAYLKRYDSGAGNDFQLINFITAGAHSIGV